LDEESTQYVKNVRSAPVDVPDLGGLRELVAQGDVSVKIPVGFDDFHLEHWSKFVEVACVVNETERACDFVALISSFATMSAGVQDSEETLVPLVDLYLKPLEALLQGSRARNKKTSSSKNGRPDYSLTASGTYFRGEEKLKGAYVPGDDKLDPVRELELKTPWDDWELFFGDAPYLLAYACVGSPSEVLVKFGILGRSTHKFEEVIEIDILPASNRPEATLILLKLAPVLIKLKMFTAAGKARIDPNWKITNGDPPNVRELSRAVVRNTAVIEKRWFFGTLEQARELCTRLALVFHSLSGDRELPWMQRFGDYSLAPGVDSDGRNYASCFFFPAGIPFSVVTASSALELYKQLAEALSLLHGRGVVHNDIRLPNVVKRTDGQHWFIVDFDDAAVLDSNGFAPGITDLDPNSHAPNIREVHGKEVDVWALGHMMTTMEVGTDDMLALGAKIKLEYKALSAREVGKLLSELKL